MSDYRAERIEKGRYFRALNPLTASRTLRPPFVIGFDSEAENGAPFLFQFSLPGGQDEDVLLVTVPDEAYAGINAFMRFVHSNCTRKDVEYLIYGWNLQYEFTQFFRDLDDEAKEMDDLNIYFEVFSPTDPKLVVGRYDIKVAQGKRHLLSIYNKRTKRTVRLFDGMAYYKTGLHNAAQMIGIAGKLDIESKQFTRADIGNETFLAYARRDAYITRRMGEHIVNLHQEYKVKQTISAPHFACTVFRRHYLQSSVDLPEPDLEQAGLYSYHGGKNGFYLPRPTKLDAIYQYDITSAYPEAMAQLPDIETAVWTAVDKYVPGVHAIWIADLDYKSCKYRGFLNPDGSWPRSRFVKDAYLTSYELDAMVMRDECTVHKCRGWIMSGPATSRGGLRAYVSDFFKLKANSTGVERDTAKLFLNSLYGKFFQKVALGIVGAYDLDTGKLIKTDRDADYDYRAGGLYHPPIASLITGFVRAKIHGMEHKYDALMTSTDGIFAYNQPDSSDIGDALGALTVEKGDLKIWRERLYIYRYGKPKPKVALHGFRAGWERLDDIPVARGRYEYTAQQMITMKMSTKSLHGNCCGGKDARCLGTKYLAGQFVMQKYVLDLTTKKVDYAATVL